MCPDQGKQYAEDLIGGFSRAFENSFGERKVLFQQHSHIPRMSWKEATAQMVAAMRIKKRLEGGG